MNITIVSMSVLVINLNLLLVKTTEISTISH